MPQGKTSKSGMCPFCHVSSIHHSSCPCAQLAGSRTRLPAAPLLPLRFLQKALSSCCRYQSHQLLCTIIYFVLDCVAGFYRVLFSTSLLLSTCCIPLQRRSAGLRHLLSFLRDFCMFCQSDSGIHHHLSSLLLLLMLFRPNIFSFQSQAHSVLGSQGTLKRCQACSSVMSGAP